MVIKYLVTEGREMNFLDCGVIGEGWMGRKVG